MTQAKVPGKCSRCDQPYAAGDAVVSTPMRFELHAHKECPKVERPIIRIVEDEIVDFDEDFGL
jgi:hypothetical protein